MSSNTFSAPAKAIITVLTIALLVTGYIAFMKQKGTSGEDNSDNAQKTSASLIQPRSLDTKSLTEDGTTLVSATTVNNCVAAYESHPKKFTQHATSQTLKGFSINVDAIRATLLDDPGIKYLHIALGVHPDHLANASAQQDFTIFVSGLKSDYTYIVKDTVSDEPYFYEYVKPCPTNCPKPPSR